MMRKSSLLTWANLLRLNRQLLIRTLHKETYRFLALQWLL